MESSLTTKFQPRNSPSSLFTVSDEEFNSFHNIDRLLFTRLILNLGRDPEESMQIMGFWLWMERDVVDDLNLVNRMLSLPVNLLSELTNESVMCLRCVESDTFPFPDGKPELFYLPSFVQRNVNFKYFFDNRIAAHKGVMKMVNQVCSRAFRGILEQGTAQPAGPLPVVSIGYSRSVPEKATHVAVQNVAPSPVVSIGYSRAINPEKATHGGIQNVAPSPVVSIGYSRTINPEKATHGGVQNLAPSLMVAKSGEVPPFRSIESGSSSNGGPPSMVTHQNPHNQYWSPYHRTPQQPHKKLVWRPVDGGASFMNAPPPQPQQGLPPETFFGGYGTRPTEKQDADFDDFSLVFRSSLNFIEEEDGVGPDERTIFLTFSKGYPISAAEVWDFFTKKFGDFIETIYMQEVSHDEQVLFARVVARSVAFVDVVVDGGRAKYNINGKHVWARKYVRKQTALSLDGVPIPMY